MSARALIAALAVVAVPIAVNGAEPQTASPRAQPKRVCEAHPEIGSRIRTIRSCRSAAELEARKQESRQVIDKVQSLKVSFGR
jgi:hypothetical protein